MKKAVLAVAKGRGNVFQDLGHANADVAQLKAILAAEIIKSLDRAGLSVRRARPRGFCGSRLFPRPQRGSRAVHRRPSHDDGQPAWVAG
jgi:hypothetical protein